VPHRAWRGATEHDVELGEAEDESVGLIYQDDVHVIAEFIGQPGGQFQATEAGAKHKNSHRPFALLLVTVVLGHATLTVVTWADTQG
jgi:hypothetical protein